MDSLIKVSCSPFLPSSQARFLSVPSSLSNCTSTYGQTTSNNYSLLSIRSPERQAQQSECCPLSRGNLKWRWKKVGWSKANATRCCHSLGKSRSRKRSSSVFRVYAAHLYSSDIWIWSANAPFLPFSFVRPFSPSQASQLMVCVVTSDSTMWSLPISSVPRTQCFNRSTWPSNRDRCVLWWADRAQVRYLPVSGSALSAKVPVSSHNLCLNVWLVQDVWR